MIYSKNIEGPYQILQVWIFVSDDSSDLINENDFESDINLVHRAWGYSKLLKYQRYSIYIGQNFDEFRISTYS